MTKTPRKIKKYPNRRLYDTETSAYITITDVKKLVLAFEPFLIVDAKTDEDLTRSILLQIILEEESGGMPLFTSELLSQIIRFYGHAMQGMVGKYLETNIKSLVDLQQKIQDQSRHLFGDNSQMKADFLSQFLNLQGPAMQNMMSTYVDQSQKMFQQIQSQLKSQTKKIFSSANVLDPEAPFSGRGGKK